MLDPSRKEDFDRLGRLVKGGENAGARFLAFFSGRWFKPGNDDEFNWLDDADRARLRQEPVRARVMLWTIFTICIVLLAWSALAPLDVVTRGVGKVVPSTGTRIVQSVDGGIIEEIAVSEGQSVEKDQLLVRVDPTRFAAGLGEREARAVSLEARAARLRALVEKKPLVFPAGLEDKSPQIVEQERQLYETGRRSLDSRLEVAGQRLDQRKQELREIGARQIQASRTLELALQELEATKPLLESGAVSEMDILRLERDVAEARGERDRSSADAARARSSVEEAQGELREAELDFRNRWRSELSETLSDLASLSESSVALEDRLRHSEIRAPIAGVVKRIFVNTPGGVLMPGSEVAELVPHGDQMIIEAMVSPKDRAFIRQGQKAIVKLTAYEYAIYGGLEGVVEHISADTITDSSKMTYYLVRVRTVESGFGEDLPVLPGMTAQVDILTAKRTVLSYILKPILRARGNALTER